MVMMTHLGPETGLHHWFLRQIIIPPTVFTMLAFLLFLSLALLVLMTLSHLLPPLHLLLIFESKDFFRVTKRLSEVDIIILPEVWE